MSKAGASVQCIFNTPYVLLQSASTSRRNNQSGFFLTLFSRAGFDGFARHYITFFV